MKKMISLIIIGILIMVSVFFGSAIMVGIYQGVTINNNTNNDTNNDINNDTNTQKNIEIKKEKEEKMELKEVELGAGFYTVGKDIQPGTYNIVHIEGQGLVDMDEYCFQIGTNRDYGDADVVKNVELKEGMKIRVTSGLWFKFVPVK